MTERDQQIAKISGFYSILDGDDEVLAGDLLRPVADGGCGSRALQVRLKPRPGQTSPAATTAEVVAVAKMARVLCTRYGALLIINDRLDIALAVDADGVHLGQDDLALADAQRVLAGRTAARPFLIGITTNNVTHVERARVGGADYIGFGPVFTTTTKANPDPVQGVEGLAAAVAAAGSMPVVGIGGITPERAGEIAKAGAAAACCVAAVNHASERAEAGAAIGAAFGSQGR